MAGESTASQTPQQAHLNPWIAWVPSSRASPSFHPSRILTRRPSRIRSSPALSTRTHARTHTVQRRLPLQPRVPAPAPHHTDLVVGIAFFCASKLLFLGCSWRALPYHHYIQLRVCATLTDPPRSFPIPGVRLPLTTGKKARPPSSPTRDLSFI